MYEPALLINDYLPLEGGSETPYMQHLWGAFETLMEHKDKNVRAFCMLPFHLLFMFSLQYKVYRISAWNNQGYLEVLAPCHVRPKGKRKSVQENAPILLYPGVINTNASVRNLSFISEEHLFKFFTLVNVDKNIIDDGIRMVRLRGTYAHANGNIEEQIETRIDEYIGILDGVQSGFGPMNDEIGNQWKTEIQEGDDFRTFVESRLQQAYLCPADFKNGILNEEFAFHIDLKDEVTTMHVEYFAGIPMTTAAKEYIKGNFDEQEIVEALAQHDGDRIELLRKYFNEGYFRKNNLPLIQPFKLEGQDCYKLSSENA